MADQIRWLTYVQLAQVLRTAPRAARALARRRGWPMKRDESLLTLVGVPIEVHQARSEGNGG